MVTTLTRQLATVAEIRAKRRAELIVRPIVTPELAQTKEGTSVNVDLHANEPGTMDRSKTRITQKPAKGAVSMSNGIATYTPAAGWIGYDTIGYQLAKSDGIYGYTGYCTIETIEGTIIVTPGKEIPMPDIDLSVPVSTQSDLQGEINNHTSSSVTKEIVVADGNYTFPTIPDSKKNLVIRAKNVNGAKFSGRGVLRGTDVILRGIWMPSGVDVSEDTDTNTSLRNRVSRCRVDGTANDGIWMSGSDMIVDGCYVDNTTQGISGADQRTCRLNRNYVNGSGGEPNRCMYLGHGGTNQQPLDMTIDYNRTENIVDHQHIEHKSSNNLVHHHYAIGSPGKPHANIYSRHGLKNVYSHCYVDNGVVGAADEDNLVADCVFVNSAGDGAAARSGSISGDDIRFTDKKGQVYAEDAIIRRCSGPVTIGWNQGDDEHGPERTVLEGISDSQINISKADEVGLIKRSPTGAPLYTDPARTLSSSKNVGQFWTEF